MNKFKIDVVGNVEAKVGQKVLLPFGEQGIIKKINTKTLDWFPIKVKITDGRIFNEPGMVLGFRPEQIKVYVDN